MNRRRRTERPGKEGRLHGLADGGGEVAPWPRTPRRRRAPARRLPRIYLVRTIVAVQRTIFHVTLFSSNLSFSTLATTLPRHIPCISASVRALQHDTHRHAYTPRYTYRHRTHAYTYIFQRKEIMKYVLNR